MNLNISKLVYLAVTQSSGEWGRGKGVPNGPHFIPCIPGPHSHAFYHSFTLTSTIGLISKKKNFISAALFFVHFFAVVLHDYNVKLPVTRFMEEMLYVFRFTFFSPPLIFSLVAASISHFPTAAIKFHVFLPTKLVFVVVVVVVVVVYLLISRSSSFSVFHVTADIKI